MDKIWKEILWIILGVGAILILLTLVLNLFEFRTMPKEAELKGSKDYVIEMIIRDIYKCWKENEGRRESVICSILKINSNEGIRAEDIIKRLDPNKIDISVVKSDDLPSSCDVIIRYENQNIYVERGEYERAGY